MKREFLQELGLTAEQVDKVMKSHGYDVTEALKKAREEGRSEAEASAAEKLAELEELRHVQKELDALKKAGMSAEEQAKAAQQQAEAERAKYLKLQGEARATGILAGAGFDEEALQTVLPSVVCEDLADTERRARGLAEVFAAATEKARRAKEEELLKNTPEPPAGAGSAANPDAAALQKQADALLAGNVSEAAYWARVAQQGEGHTTTE